MPSRRARISFRWSRVQEDREYKGFKASVFLKLCESTPPPLRRERPFARNVRQPLEASQPIGAPEEIRTPDPQIRSLVLYPAELRARVAAADAKTPVGPERP